jgi:hypothetical protein
LPQERKVPTISAEQAEQLAEKQIVYNGRIAPFNTMARDFLLKTYGKSTYHQLTPEQVVCGWILVSIFSDGNDRRRRFGIEE